MSDMNWKVLVGVGLVVVSLALPAAGATPRPRFVREAQRVLEDLGYRPGPVDGVVGHRTQAALARYQRAERIPVTGLLDAETMVRLDIQQRVARRPDQPASR